MFERVSNWWRRKPGSIRWAVFTCLPAGIVLLALGWYGDGHGWWNNRAFVTNVVSSFTGLMFGIPFAVLVLSRLSKDQAEAAAREESIAQARTAVDEFFGAWWTGIKRADARTMNDRVGEWRAANRQLLQILRLSETGPRDIDERRQTAAQIDQFVQERDAARAAVFDTGRRSEWITLIVRSWRRLDEDVRPQMQRAGLPWISSAANVALHDAFRQFEAIELDNGVGNRLRRARMFAPPHVPDDQGWLQAKKLLEAEAEAEAAVALALRDVVKNLDRIERIGS
ncbi:hypothetical protein [Streptomyces sp. NPDC048191]|uniref:hypothetical protein n=1 Tax=Streptomyces sp. NPDC048191 TaxID=3155484 RepID=UPI0033F4594A